MSRPFEEIADELYGLPPTEFTARRDEHARAARDRGERETASAITALRKPSTAAWLANQLVRVDRSEVAGFLELGAGLREAQAKLEGDALRALARQRRQVVNELIRRARKLAADHGRPISESVARELEQTLEAALADPEAAAALESGRLTASLSPSGAFGAAARHLHAVPPDGEPAESAAAARAREAFDRAQDRKQEAQRRQAGAAHVHAEAAREIERAETEVAQLRSRLEELEMRLDAGKDRVAGARKNERVARRELQTAERELQTAERELQSAERDLETAKRAADDAGADTPQ